MSNVNTWTPIWSSIVDSSIWEEPDFVIKVWLTMLAKKDACHIYYGDPYRLAQQSRKTELEVLDALKILASPDERKINKGEHDGRRIKPVDGGWIILNGEKYREMMQIEMKRARDRRAQAKRRERLRSQPLSGEDAYLRNHEALGRKDADQVFDNTQSIKQ